MIKDLLRFLQSLSLVNVFCGQSTVQALIPFVLEYRVVQRRNDARVMGGICKAEKGGDSMYIVRWCGQDGVQRERRFPFRGDAEAEARYLARHFDGVEVVEEEEED